MFQHLLHNLRAFDPHCGVKIIYLLSVWVGEAGFKRWKGSESPTILVFVSEGGTEHGHQLVALKVGDDQAHTL